MRTCRGSVGSSKNGASCKRCRIRSFSEGVRPRLKIHPMADCVLCFSRCGDIDIAIKRAPLTKKNPITTTTKSRQDKRDAEDNALWKELASCWLVGPTFAKSGCAAKRRDRISAGNHTPARK